MKPNSNHRPGRSPIEWGAKSRKIEARSLRSGNRAGAIAEGVRDVEAD